MLGRRSSRSCRASMARLSARGPRTVSDTGGSSSGRLNLFDEERAHDGREDEQEGGHPTIRLVAPLTRLVEHRGRDQERGDRGNGDRHPVASNETHLYTCAKKYMTRATAVTAYAQFSAIRRVSSRPARRARPTVAPTNAPSAPIIRTKPGCAGVGRSAKTFISPAAPALS